LDFSLRSAFRLISNLCAQFFQSLLKRKKIFQYEFLCEVEPFVTSRHELLSGNLFEFFAPLDAKRIAGIGHSKANCLAEVSFSLRVGLDHVTKIPRWSRTAQSASLFL